MTVRDIIKDAMRLAGRSDAADSLKETTTDSELLRLQYDMLFCYNAVIDELARAYFPVKAEEEMSSDSGKFAFDDFEHTPVRIVKVFKDGKPIEWKLSPQYIEVKAQDIVVQYEYAPDQMAAGDEFYYPDCTVGTRLIEYGMAAEYLLICGEVESASCWESRYRAEIDRLLSQKTVKQRIPPRRWL